jgi:IS30 family transposase
MTKRPFTYEERKIIEQSIQMGFNNGKIADVLNRRTGTISAEVLRNGGYKNYCAQKAHFRKANELTKKCEKSIECDATEFLKHLCSASEHLVKALIFISESYASAQK